MMLQHNPLAVMSAAADFVAALGCIQAAVGAVLVHRFGAGGLDAQDPIGILGRGTSLPPVTVLKPLYGDEPLLEDALASFCVQDYPHVQIVFGVQSRIDSAIPVVRRLQARFPTLDLVLVVDPTLHGDNYKIANLINMLPSASHDVLVISDSDIHAEPTYLRHVVRALQAPGIGLVTTLYGGRTASPTLARRLAAGQINHSFLPGVLMSRVLGRQDCLGSTMALNRYTLEAIGGLSALSPHIADDSALGQLVRANGQSIAIADAMTMTTTAEVGFNDLFAHELRWGRTVRSVEPLGYALSAIQLPLFWATVAVLLLPESLPSWLALAFVWMVRFLSATVIDRALGQAATLPIMLLPVRDWLSAAVMLGSFTGRRVAWRGQTMRLPDQAIMTTVHSRLAPALAPGIDAGN
ncbi:MAG: bacteriohopanetetrol glucosamine biosynthesis glycosyltransferase HpnI [Janthinobacterium lividum]